MSIETGTIGTFETDHCVTGSLRHIYAFHGMDISEDLLLGLGAGVGFVYWHMKGQVPFLGGRANTGRPGEEGLERTAGRRTGVHIEIHQTSSSAKAERELLQRLAGGPVMLKVDMGFLPYLNIPAGYHFGGHVVVACGYESSGRQVLIVDRDTRLHPVLLEDLGRARGSKHKPFPPKNSWYDFDFRGKRLPSAEEVREAIRECVEGMLEPPIRNLGVRGIRKAGECVERWADLMKPDALRAACFNAFVFIDATGGTGGGLFRYMYGRFLAEAFEITGEKGLADVSREMHRLGDDWQRIAEAFRQAYDSSLPGQHLRACTRLLCAVADCEQDVWVRLQGFTEGK